jgi:hypothetical protein
MPRWGCQGQERKGRKGREEEASEQERVSPPSRTEGRGASVLKRPTEWENEIPKPKPSPKPKAKLKAQA